MSSCSSSDRGGVGGMLRGLGMGFRRASSLGSSLDEMPAPLSGMEENGCGEHGDVAMAAMARLGVNLLSSMMVVKGRN